MTAAAAAPMAFGQTTAGALQLRITFADTWATGYLSARPDDSIASVKARVLAEHRIPRGQADDFEVKHGGVPVRDESRSLSALGIRNGAAMIVLARRRRAVR